MLVVTIPWVGLGYNMPQIGTLIDPPEPVRSQLLGMGVCALYENKVDPMPPNIKKKRPSELSQAARPQRLRMRKNSQKFVTKS